MLLRHDIRDNTELAEILDRPFVIKKNNQEKCQYQAKAPEKVSEFIEDMVKCKVLKYY